MTIYFVIYKHDMPITKDGVNFPYINNHVHIHFFCNKHDVVNLPQIKPPFIYRTHICGQPYNKAVDFYRVFKDLSDCPLYGKFKYVRLRGFKPSKPKKIQSTDTLG